MSPSTESAPQKSEPADGVGLDSAIEFNGSWVIGGIMALGAAASIFAWLFQHYQTDESLAFWGSEAAQRIRLASQVELLQLGPADDPKSIERLTGPGISLGVTNKRDISQARGLTHARQALLQDVSYQYDRPPADCTGPFSIALRFSSESNSATLLFDLNCPRVRNLSTGAEARLGQRLTEGLKKFLGEQLDEAEKKTGAKPKVGADEV